MPDIFISYAREDIATARIVAKELEARGWSLFWDRRIPHGQDFNAYLQKQIDAAWCIVVLWSKTSVASQFVRDEAAEGLDGRLVPVLIESTRQPLGFRQLQAADLSGWRGQPADEEFSRLLSSIEALAPVSRPTGTARDDFTAATDNAAIAQPSTTDAAPLYIVPSALLQVAEPSETSKEERAPRENEVERTKAAERERAQREEAERTRAAAAERARRDEVERTKVAERERAQRQEAERAKAAVAERARRDEVERTKAAERERAQRDDAERTKAAAAERARRDEVERTKAAERERAQRQATERAKAAAAEHARPKQAERAIAAEGVPRAETERAERVERNSGSRSWLSVTFGSLFVMFIPSALMGQCVVGVYEPGTRTNVFETTSGVVIFLGIYGALIAGTVWMFGRTNRTP
jgi:hypothetical protein